MVENSIHCPLDRLPGTLRDIYIATEGSYLTELIEIAGGTPIEPPAPHNYTQISTEALVSMGTIPHPATGETIQRRNQAKYLIDTLDMLKQKTAGNLTPEETAALDDVLHQLRMAFVAGANG